MTINEALNALSALERELRAYGHALGCLNYDGETVAPRNSAPARGETMAFLREVCGECEILGCGVPLCSAFGKVEYCRIGPDMSLDYDDKLYMRIIHRERVSTKCSMRNTVFRRQLSGRAFWNDPDVFLLRHDNISLTWEERETLATVNSQFGGVLFTSDDVSGYDEKQRALLEQTLNPVRAKKVTVGSAGGHHTLTLDGKTVILK